MSSQDWTEDPRTWSSHRFLIVGQAPARSATDDMRPWDSASGRRLAAMMDITHEQLMTWFDTTNLNLKLRGKLGKWDAFDADEALLRAEKLRACLFRWKVVLCCGVRVAKLMHAPVLEWQDVYIDRAGTNGEHVWVAGIPHPGGTNMWWNKPENRGRAYDFLKTFGEYLKYEQQVA